MHDLDFIASIEIELAMDEVAPKKGQVNDATADKIKAASQNTTDGVLALPKVVKRCKVEPLTKELKSFSVYKKLRQERINARYNGMRIKRAKEAEEKKK